MCIQDIVQIITSIISVLTLPILIFTLWEMIRQRRHSYKPDMYIKSSIFYLYRDEKEDEFYWLNKPLKKGKLSDYSVNWFNLNVFNVGIGPAVDVEVKIEYNFEEIISIIKSLSLPDLDIILLADEITVNYKVRKNMFHVELPRYNDKRFYNFIINTSNESFSISLHTTFIFLVSLLCNLISHYKLFSSEKANIHIKPIKVTFEYFDVGGKKILKKQYIQVELGAILPYKNATEYFTIGEFRVSNKLSRYYYPLIRKIAHYQRESATN